MLGIVGIAVVTVGVAGMLGIAGTAVVAATVGQLHGAVGTAGTAGKAGVEGSAGTAPAKAEASGTPGTLGTAAAKEETSGTPGTAAAKVAGFGKAGISGMGTGTAALILFIKPPNYAWLWALRLIAWLALASRAMAIESCLNILPIFFNLVFFLLYGCFFCTYTSKNIKLRNFLIYYRKKSK